MITISILTLGLCLAFPAALAGVVCYYLGWRDCMRRVHGALDEVLPK